MLIGESVRNPFSQLLGCGADGRLLHPLGLSWCSVDPKSQPVSRVSRNVKGSSSRRRRGCRMPGRSFSKRFMVLLVAPSSFGRAIVRRCFSSRRLLPKCVSELLGQNVRNSVNFLACSWIFPSQRLRLRAAQFMPMKKTVPGSVEVSRGETSNSVAVNAGTGPGSRAGGVPGGSRSVQSIGRDVAFGHERSIERRIAPLD